MSSASYCPTHPFLPPSLPPLLPSSFQVQDSDIRTDIRPSKEEVEKLKRKQAAAAAAKKARKKEEGEEEEEG